MCIPFARWNKWVWTFSNQLDIKTFRCGEKNGWKKQRRKSTEGLRFGTKRTSTSPVPLPELISATYVSFFVIVSCPIRRTYTEWTCFNFNFEACSTYETYDRSREEKMFVKRLTELGKRQSLSMNIPFGMFEKLFITDIRIYFNFVITFIKWLTGLGTRQSLSTNISFGMFKKLFITDIRIYFHFICIKAPNA